MKKTLYCFAVVLFFLLALSASAQQAEFSVEITTPDSLRNVTTLNAKTGQKFGLLLVRKDTSYLVDSLYLRVDVSSFFGGGLPGFAHKLDSMRLWVNDIEQANPTVLRRLYFEDTMRIDLWCMFHTDTILCGQAVAATFYLEAFNQINFVSPLSFSRVCNSCAFGVPYFEQEFGEYVLVDSFYHNRLTLKNVSALDRGFPDRAELLIPGQTSQPLVFLDKRYPEWDGFFDYKVSDPSDLDSAQIVFYYCDHQVAVPVSNSLNTVDILEFPELSIYPNPTKGVVWIEGLPSRETAIYLLSIQQEVLETFLARDRHGLPLVMYPPGVYLVRIETDNGWTTRKIVKN